MRRGMSVGQVLLTAGFGFILFFLGTLITPKPKEQVREQERIAVDNVITMECTSLAGTTLIFSLKTFYDPEINPPVYRAVDKNGVLVVIDSQNYGEWKCKE